MGLPLINNVVILSGEKQRDSAIHTHVSVLPPNALPIQAATLSRVPCATQLGPCWLSNINIACPSPVKHYIYIISLNPH